MSRLHASRPVRPVTRRTALGALTGAALVGVATAGCGTQEASTARAAGSRTEPADTDRDTDRDTDLLTALVGEVDEVIALLEVVRRREPALRPRVVRLLAVHRRHRELLASAVDVPAPSARPRGVPRGRAAGTEVTRREQQLAARLADAATEAESGTFARVLASMSAGLRQQLAAA